MKYIINGETFPTLKSLKQQLVTVKHISPLDVDFIIVAFARFGIPVGQDVHFLFQEEDDRMKPVLYSSLGRVSVSGLKASNYLGHNA